MKIKGKYMHASIVLFNNLMYTYNRPRREVD
jgi:hypothetical protein